MVLDSESNGRAFIATLGPGPADGNRCRFPSIHITVHLSPHYDQLTSQRHVLCLKSTLRLERRDQEGQEEAEQRDQRRRR
jgi:hypothetical protein